MGVYMTYFSLMLSFIRTAEHTTIDRLSFKTSNFCINALYTRELLGVIYLASLSASEDSVRAQFLRRQFSCQLFVSV